MTRSSNAAAQYARMTDVERCAMAGKLMRRTWYARVYQPDAVDRLIAKGRPVARMQQVPAWLTGGDPRTHVFMGGRGSGKDLAIDTPILTASRGWQTMGSIEVGDVVFDEHGSQCNVTWISDVTTAKPMYRIRFSDKSELVASDTHEWLTKTSYERHKKRSGGTVRTTTELLRTITSGSAYNHSIDVCDPIEYDAHELPIDPYDLGIWLGDGYSKSRILCLSDRDAPEVVSAMNHIDKTWNQRRDRDGESSSYRFTIESWKKIRSLGVVGDKHIPKEYLEGSVSQRERLLAGIIDSDGSIDISGRECSITSHRESLVKGIFELVIGLGLKPTIREYEATLYKVHLGHSGWEIRFRLSSDRGIPVNAGFKRSRIENQRPMSSSISMRLVTSIERTVNVPCRCIAVDSPSHLYLAGDRLIPTHNTRCATGWFVPEILERPGYRLGVLGPDFKIAVGVCIKGQSGIKTILEEFDPTLIAKWDDVKNVMTLINGSQVFCYSSEYPKSLEGPEHSGYWCDEVAELMGAGGDNCIWRKRAEPGIRLIGANGEPVRKIITGTPEATRLIADLYEKSTIYTDAYGWTQLATRDNIDNLDAEMVEQMYLEAGDSHFAKMKLEGHLILESPHALLSAADLAAIRLTAADPRFKDPSDMEKTVLCVDANHSDDAKSDECGIIVMGRLQGRGYVFADASCRGGSKAWGERLIAALIAYPEIREVACEDEGLVIDVVEKILHEDSALERIGRPIKIRKMKHGNRSKRKRADPVAALYQRKRMLHAPCARTPEWSLEQLEWQWSSWSPLATGAKAKSPDRIDACTYGGERLLLRDAAPDTFFKASDVASWGH